MSGATGTPGSVLTAASIVSPWFGLANSALKAATGGPSSAGGGAVYGGDTSTGAFNFATDGGTASSKETVDKTTATATAPGASASNTPAWLAYAGVGLAALSVILAMKK